MGRDHHRGAGDPEALAGDRHRDQFQRSITLTGTSTSAKD